MGTLIKIPIFVLFIITNICKADPIPGYAAVIQILDKVTAKITTIEINVGENYKFDSLNIKIFSCKKRPPEEIPEDFVLLVIMDEIKKNQYLKVFQGWMLSSSPTIAPFEHPTYDLWVRDCKIKSDSE